MIHMYYFNEFTKTRSGRGNSQEKGTRRSIPIEEIGRKELLDQEKKCGEDCEQQQSLPRVIDLLLH